MTRPASPAVAAGGRGELLRGLLRLVLASRPDADTQLISLAYDVAAYWQQGQKRKSGDPYITLLRPSGTARRRWPGCGPGP